ncbi:MAG: L,D-transpeptidase family protein [bacterium]|nr:L,D-transpeptidase family protein [bacterium]
MRSRLFMLLIGVFATTALLGGFLWHASEDQHALFKTIAALQSDKAAKSLAVVDTSFINSGVLPAVENDRDLDAEKDKFIASKRSFIYTDLAAMTIDLYKDGERIAAYPIAAKGREGSWWETPSGSYTVLSRESTHFSSIGKVWQPWSIQFYGNFFIHGWPYDAKGKDVPPGYSGGCIRLNTDDAKIVYDFARRDMPVLVKGDSVPPENYAALTLRSPEAAKIPDLSAQSVLVADVITGDVYLNKNGSDVLPIASIVKLMTAVVTSELVNLESSVSISREMLTTSPFQSVKLPLRGYYRAFDLFYPLLIESSNGTAEALTTFVGRTEFIKNMNTKAKALGMTNTRFFDPSGVEDENVGTGKDLLLLARYIFEKRNFIYKISKGEKYADMSPTAFVGLYNLNDFHNDPDLAGSKIGETKAAKQTSVVVWNFNTPAGRAPVAVIVLGSDDQSKDQQTILDWLTKNFEIVRTVKK